MPIDYKLQLTRCVKIIKKAKYVLQIHTDVLFCFSGQKYLKNESFHSKGWSLAFVGIFAQQKSHNHQARSYKKHNEIEEVSMKHTLKSTHFLPGISLTGRRFITGLTQRGRQPFTDSQFRITSEPPMHIFGPCEENEGPGEYANFTQTLLLDLLAMR